jgi:RND family efflux transporter MFP subunit
MKNNIIRIILALVLIISAAFVVQSCTDSKGEAPPIPKTSEPIPVTVMSLEKSVGGHAIKASGQLTTEDETILGFKTGGIVNAVFVKAGDRIKKGQLLARLDLTEINAQVTQAKHGLEKAQRDFNRAKNLYRDSVATLEQLQNTETAFAVAREQFDAAKFNLSYSEIHASQDGYVLKKFVNAGQVIGVGDPVLQTNSAAEGNWILKIGVSDKQWAGISTNDKAKVNIDAFPKRTFDANVIRKTESADPQTGVFTVELRMKDEGEKFASGMFGAAVLTSNEIQTSWSVPYEAVLDASDDKGFVFITNDNQLAIKVPVTIASFNGQAIRISDGLEGAKALILSGSAYLSDKSTITVIK